MNNDFTQPSSNLLAASFRDAWDSGAQPKLQDFVAKLGATSTSGLLQQLVLIDVDARVRRGIRVSIAEYFRQVPKLADAMENLDWLVEVEALLERVQPDWQDELRHEFPDVVDRFRSHAPVASTLKAKNAELTKQRKRQAIQPGDVVGDFEIGELVGEGTYGRVFLARDITLDRHVALKVSKTLETGSESNNEGRLLARLSHGGIVSVYGQQFVDGLSLLAMQFVPGGPLSVWIQQSQGSNETTTADYLSWAGKAKVPAQFSGHSLPSPKIGDRYVDAIVWLVSKMAQALEHAHSRGVLHHDVKPSNIMIDPLGNPLLTDFNVASVRDGDAQTIAGGTLSYMSPEHLKAISTDLRGDMDAVDVRSDLYSLGVVLYELLTGRKHWQTLHQKSHSGGLADNDSLNQLLADRLRSGPASVNGVSGITASLVSIVKKALEPDPANRYQTAPAFARDLECWLGGLPLVYARETDWREKSIRWGRRHRTPLLTAAGAFLALTIGAGLLMRSESSQLRNCAEFAEQAGHELVAGNNAGAAEAVGQAKAELARVRLSRFAASARFAEVSQAIKTESRKIGNFELQRFTSRFGEFSLTNAHQTGSTDGAELIENSLRSYGVLQRDDWQSRSPFVDLAAGDQEMVAENIAELLLVSLLAPDNGDSPRPPFEKVLARFPAQHRQLEILAKVQGQDFTKLRSTNPLHVENGFEAYLYGVISSEKKEYSQAHAWFERSLALRKRGDTQRFWAHYWLGFVCQQLGKDDEALVRYGTCIGLRPDFAWLPFNTGLAFAKRGEVELAKRFIENAITLDLQFASAYVALGAIQHQEQLFNAALATYDRASQQGIESAELLQNRASTLLELDQRASAIECLERAVELSPRPEIEEALKRLKSVTP